MKIFKDKKFLKECAIILLVGLLVNGACFLMGTIHSKAATSSTALPYLANMNDGYSLTRPELVEIIGTLSSAGYELGDNFVVFRTFEYRWYTYNDYIQTPAYVIYDFPSLTNETVFYGSTYEDFEFNNSSKYIKYGANGSGHGYIYTMAKQNIGTTYNGYAVSRSDGALIQHLFGDASMTTVANNYFSGAYNAYYPVYCTGVFVNAQNYPILSNLTTTSPDATDFENSPNITTFDPNTKPTVPTITAPSIDSSQSLIDNIKALFTWLGDTIKSLLKWLIDSIANFFDNLTAHLKDFINAVINAINNGFNNVFQNFKSLFQPFIDEVVDAIGNLNDFFDNTGQRLVNIVTRLGDIFGRLGSLYDKIDGFIDFVKAPLDMDAINTAWVGSAIGGSFTTYYTQTLIVKGLFDSLSNISAPNTLSFTVDFSNAPEPFDTVGSVTFNFDWYENIRYIVTPLISAFIIFGCVMHLIQTLPSIIQGSGSASEQYQLHNGGITTITMSDRVGTKAHSVTTSTRRRI